MKYVWVLEFYDREPESSVIGVYAALSGAMQFFTKRIEWSAHKDSEWRGTDWRKAVYHIRLVKLS